MKKIWLLLILIIISIVVRFYKLGQVPHGMTWDEAAIGYNGYAILHTRRDEWLTRLPISFKSFGDFKAPLAIYLNGIFTFLFGMNLTAVRIPFALAGVIAIWAIYLVSSELLRTYTSFKTAKIQNISLLSSALLSFSPWHIHYSRTGFESGMTMTMLLIAFYLFLKFINFQTKKQTKFSIKKFLLLLSFTVLWSASLYTYHSAKIVVPILSLFILIFYFRSFWKNKTISLLCLTIFIFLLRPLLIDTFSGEGMTRAGTLIFSQNLTTLELVRTITNNYLIHFKPAFLINGQTTTLRHGTGKWGILLPTTYFLIIFYLLRLFWVHQKKKQNSAIQHPMVRIPILLIFIGIIPAALGEEIPHSNRAILALPGFILLTSLAINSLFEMTSNIKIKKFKDSPKFLSQMIGGLLLVSHLLLFFSFQSYYYQVFAQKSAVDFKDGYLEAFNLTSDYEKGENGKNQVDEIIFTSDYGQPYIYALFVRKTNPIWYQGGSLVKYKFTDKIDIGDLSRKNTLVVASNEDDIPENETNHLIFGSDGEIKFKIYYLE